MYCTYIRTYVHTCTQSVMGMLIESCHNGTYVNIIIHFSTYIHTYVHTYVRMYVCIMCTWIICIHMYACIHVCADLYSPPGLHLAMGCWSCGMLWQSVVVYSPVSEDGYRYKLFKNYSLWCVLLVLHSLSVRIFFSLPFEWKTKGVCKKSNHANHMLWQCIYRPTWLLLLLGICVAHLTCTRPWFCEPVACCGNLLLSLLLSVRTLYTHWHWLWYLCPQKCTYANWLSCVSSYIGRRWPLLYVHQALPVHSLAWPWGSQIPCFCDQIHTSYQRSSLQQITSFGTLQVRICMFVLCNLTSCCIFIPYIRMYIQTHRRILTCSLCMKCVCRFTNIVVQYITLYVCVRYWWTCQMAPLLFNVISCLNVHFMFVGKDLIWLPFSRPDMRN